MKRGLSLTWFQCLDVSLTWLIRVTFSFQVVTAKLCALLPHFIRCWEWPAIASVALGHFLAFKRLCVIKIELSSSLVFSLFSRLYNCWKTSKSSFYTPLCLLELEKIFSLLHFVTEKLLAPVVSASGMQRKTQTPMNSSIFDWIFQLFVCLHPLLDSSETSIIFIQDIQIPMGLLSNLKNVFHVLVLIDLILRGGTFNCWCLYEIRNSKFYHIQ